jgi:Xaa-Pro aminopeptidase
MRRPGISVAGKWVMARNPDRSRIISQALVNAGFDAVVCARPANVLMLSDYCPVVGTAVAVATVDGRLAVVAPEDERELASGSGADFVRTFEPATLAALARPGDALQTPLVEAVRDLGIQFGRIARESGSLSEPAHYAAVHLYGAELRKALAAALPAATVAPADGLLERLRRVKTAAEVERIRVACDVAADAYSVGRAQLRPGMTEAEAAACFRTPLFTSRPEMLDAVRGDGFAYCMSGPNAYAAYAAYQRSRGRRLMADDLVLVHCNSYVGGYWTDITRTFHLGQPDERAKLMYEAVFAARDAALATTRPGVPAAEVDRAARNVMRRFGLGDNFLHSTGHGVGFTAIDHNAPPRLHPASPDVLEPGMVLNVEPGAYVEGYGGLRHCDMIEITGSGCELLTPFLTRPEELVVPG